MGRLRTSAHILGTALLYVDYAADGLDAKAN